MKQTLIQLAKRNYVHLLFLFCTTKVKKLRQYCWILRSQCSELLNIAEQKFLLFVLVNAALNRLCALYGIVLGFQRVIGRKCLNILDIATDYSALLKISVNGRHFGQK